MRLEQHIVLSAAVSGALYGLTRSWPMAASSMAVGVLIDGDHLLEYVREYGPRIDMKQFFRASYEREYKQRVLILHAWEWLPGLLLIAWLSGWNPWLTGGVIGWVQHMLADTFANTPNRMAYFILWRRRHGFDHKFAFPFYDSARPTATGEAGKDGGDD